MVCLFCLPAILPFFVIAWKLFQNGFKQFNGNLFTQVSPTSTEALLACMGSEIIPGGILNGICGSILILSIAILLAVPLGILAGIYIYDNRSRKLTSIISYAGYILQGTSAIVIGLIVYLWIVKPFHGFSAFAGGIALAIFLLPRVARSTLRALNTLPVNLMESGIALGGSYTGVTLKIVLPATHKNLLSNILMSVSQIVGMTAPLIITALGSSGVNWDPGKPTATISLLVWNFFNNPNTVNLMWSSALILFLIVIGLNITAKYMNRSK
ncbi:MAG: ABC transporter permease subunit [Candidatus Symbiothrix sp.]|jgi:phosphate transport system permease protein|nr:ABC transporter permease subunit [Candidatus Symbiothrix sp.]